MAENNVTAICPFPRKVAKTKAEIITNNHRFSKKWFPCFSIENCQFGIFFQGKLPITYSGNLSQALARRKIAMLPKETSTYAEINVNLTGPPHTVNGQQHDKALHEQLFLL